MKVYLAASLTNTYLSDDAFNKRPYALQTFYGVTEKAIERFPLCKDVMIDSGAFSIRSQDAKDPKVYWEYLHKYAAFINAHKIEHFFELDIDNIVGYEEVVRYRRELERLTGKQPIVVWHPSRGIPRFIEHCKEYAYVALGGYAGANMRQRNQYKKAYPWFIETAHQNNTRIHGLGFTSFNDLPKCHFDSVDSTAWLSGARYGSFAMFNGKKIKLIDRPQKKRAINRKIVEHNFTEWIKFQKYAEVHL